MEGKVVRRRLIQSTLFPHTDSSIKNVEDCDVNRQEEVAGEEEEWCGSSKSRRGSKRKGNSKSKTTPPASLKKVSVVVVLRALADHNCFSLPSCILRLSLVK